MTALGKNLTKEDQIPYGIEYLALGHEYTIRQKRKLSTGELADFLNDLIFYASDMNNEAAVQDRARTERNFRNYKTTVENEFDVEINLQKGYIRGLEGGSGFELLVRYCIKFGLPMEFRYQKLMDKNIEMRRVYPMARRKIQFNYQTYRKDKAYNFKYEPIECVLRHLGHSYRHFRQSFLIDHEFVWEK